MTNTSANNSMRQTRITFADDNVSNGDAVEKGDVARYLGCKEAQSCTDEMTKPLSSVAAFQEELKRMSKMEDDFVKGTIELQKRLGIDASGFVL